MNHYKRGNFNLRVKSRSRLAGFCCFILLLFLLYNTTSTASAQEAPGLKEQFEKKISQLVGVPVSVAKYGLNYDTITLRGIKIGNPARPELPSANIKQLSASCDFMSLLVGKLVLKEVTIASLSGRLTLDSSGNLVLGKIPLPASSTLPADSTDLPFLNIRGSDLEFKITDKRTDQTLVLQIPSVSVSRPATASEMLVDLKGIIARVPFLANIRAEALSPLKASGSVAVGPAPAEALLTVLKTLVPGRINAVQVNGGKAEASLNFSTAPGKAASFDFKSQFSEIKSISAPPSQAVDNVSGNMTFTGTFANGILNGTFLLTKLKGSPGAGQMPISIERCTGKVSGLGTKTGKVSFAETMATIMGTDVHASGSIETGKNGYLALEARVPSYNAVIPVSAADKSSYTFPFKNLVGSFRYAGNTLTIKKASAGLFGGTLEGTGTILPGNTPISFNVNAKGKGVQTEAFLAQNTSQKQVISGPISATFQMAGNASGLATWNGKGSLLMQNGKYQAPPVITPFLSLVNLKEFAAGDLKEASGTFALNGGILTTNDFTCLSSAGTADYRGNVGLDTSLKGNLSLHFSQAAVQQSQVLQQISLDGKTVSIPTRVEGTLQNPSFPGFSTNKLLELGLKRKGQKMLQDILLPGSKKPAGTESAPDQQKKDSGKELIENLQNIFKKKKKPATSPGTTTPAAPAPTKKEDALTNELKKLFKF